MTETTIRVGLQKSLYAHYVDQGVCIEDGDLERAANRKRQATAEFDD